MKKIIIPILLGLALIASSCESKLDIPQKGVISYSNFFESDADAQASLANMYAAYCDNVSGATGYIYVPELMILNYSADDVLAAGGDAGDHGDFHRELTCEVVHVHFSAPSFKTVIIIANLSHCLQQLWRYCVEG